MSRDDGPPDSWRYGGRLAPLVPRPTLEDDVRAVLESHGWVERAGEFALRRHRTTFRGSLADFLLVARRLGLDALRELVARESAALTREATRNLFRERRLARTLPEVVEAGVREALGPIDVRGLDPGGLPGGRPGAEPRRRFASPEDLADEDLDPPDRR